MSVFRAFLALILSILLALCSQEASADRPRDTGTTPPRFQYRGLERALRSVAWTDLGRELAALQPMLERRIPNDRGVAPLRRKVLARLELLRRAGIRSSGPHGVLTHPAVFVNAIHFTLDEADRPLTGSQADELYRIGSQFVAAERERRRTARGETIALARLLDEVDLKGRMQFWVRASLTRDQQNLLEPEATRELVGWSFFSSCSVLGPYARPVVYARSDQLLEKLLRARTEALRLTAAEVPIVRAHLARFVEQVELGVVPSRTGVLPRAHTLRMARRTVQMRRALLKEPSLRASVRARIARERGFRVPMRITAPLAVR